MYAQHSFRHMYNINALDSVEYALPHSLHSCLELLGKHCRILQLQAQVWMLRSVKMFSTVVSSHYRGGGRCFLQQGLIQSSSSPLILPPGQTALFHQCVNQAYFWHLFSHHPQEQCSGLLKLIVNIWSVTPEPHGNNLIQPYRPYQCSTVCSLMNMQL